jgi:hypothetical protein
MLSVMDAVRIEEVHAGEGVMAGAAVRSRLGGPRRITSRAVHLPTSFLRRLHRSHRSSVTAALNVRGTVVPLEMTSVAPAHTSPSAVHTVVGQFSVADDLIIPRIQVLTFQKPLLLTIA